MIVTILSILVIFGCGIFFLLLSVKFAGKNNNRFALAYLLFSIIAIIIGFLVSFASIETEEKIKPIEEICIEMGGYYKDNMCFDYKKAPLLNPFI